MRYGACRREETPQQAAEERTIAFTLDRDGRGKLPRLTPRAPHALQAHGGSETETRALLPGDGRGQRASRGRIEHTCPHRRGKTFTTPEITSNTTEERKISNVALSEDGRYRAYVCSCSMLFLEGTLVQPHFSPCRWLYYILINQVPKG